VTPFRGISSSIRGRNDRGPSRRIP
jgi:hypothetical protein